MRALILTLAAVALAAGCANTIPTQRCQTTSAGIACTLEAQP